MKVRWTGPAVEQLQGIFEYIAADQAEAALRIVRRIRASILRAVQLPNSGRVGRVKGTREIAVPGTPYLVAYRVAGESIHVLAILHGAQAWPQSL